MKVKRVIIHNVKKDVNSSPKIILSDALLETKEEKTKSLIEDLYSFFQKSIKYGIFDMNEKTMFSENFENYINNKNITDNDFILFSNTVLADLKSRMDSIPQSKGGYIVFSELSNLNEDYFVVFVVRDKNGRQFSYKNNKMEIKEVIHVDTNKLAMACRINLSSYKNNKDRYLSFLSTTQDEASKYFIKWIGAEAQSKSFEDTKNFRKLINLVEPPKDENGNFISREELRKRIHEICQKTYSNDIKLRVIAEEVWQDPDYLTQYAENNGIKINDTFTADKRELNKLKGLSFSGDMIKLSFPPEYIGDKIRIDDDDSSVVVIESVNLANQLREELK